MEEREGGRGKKKDNCVLIYDTLEWFSRGITNEDEEKQNKKQNKKIEVREREREREREKDKRILVFLLLLPRTMSKFDDGD